MYDKESIYDEKVSPLMTEIIKICKENDIKMVADFYLREPIEEENEFHCTTALTVGENTSERLKDLVRSYLQWICCTKAILYSNDDNKRKVAYSSTQVVKYR